MPLLALDALNNCCEKFGEIEMFIWKSSMIKYELFHQVLNDWIWPMLGNSMQINFLCVCECASNQRHEKTSLKMAIVRVAACIQYVLTHKHIHWKGNYLEKSTHFDWNKNSDGSNNKQRTSRLFRTMFFKSVNRKWVFVRVREFCFHFACSSSKCVYSIWSHFFPSCSLPFWFNSIWSAK